MYPSAPDKLARLGCRLGRVLRSAPSAIDQVAKFAQQGFLLKLRGFSHTHTHIYIYIYTLLYKKC